MKPRTSRTWKIALAVPAVALVAACGTHTTHDSAGSAPVVAAPDDLSFEANDSTEARSPADVGAATSAEPAEDPAIEGRAVISTGQVSLHTPKIDAARFDLVKILDTFGGEISSENSSGDDHGRTERDRLELRVPTKNFAAAMDALATIDGTTLAERTSSSEDVTTKVIDVNTRVRTQKLSLARVQALLDRATSIDEIIRIEGQVAKRQADLDSLEQQQKYLADQTALSTITVYLTVPDGKKAAPPHHAKTHHTFLTGLDAGWDSLSTLTRNVLAGVGAALPYAAVVAALALVVRLGRRRRVSAR